MSAKSSTNVFVSALAAAVMIAAAALGGGNAAAASGHHRHAVAVHRIHRPYAARHWRRYARRYPPAYYGYPIPPSAIHEPGYVFVPGRGILGEACDMPTSTCSNQYRIVR